MESDAPPAANGAAALLQAAERSGVRICFTNPGTTELPLVQALDAVPGIRPVLGLFEGVCTGAADGHSRMTGDPAMTLLHLGPGLANGLANLHNARRARSPVITVVGDHATDHLDADPPLASDIATLAAPMSCWVGTARTANDMAPLTLEAGRAARAQGPATLIAPADCQWGAVDTAAAPAAAPGSESTAAVGRPSVGESAVQESARLLRAGGPAVLLLGGAALGERGLRAAEGIARSTGCTLLCETFPARMERGRGLPAPTKLPYPMPQASALLAGSRAVLLAGARAPVAFFAVPGQPRGPVPPDAAVSVLSTPDEDVVDALERLADELPAGGQPRPRPEPATLDVPTGPLDAEALGAVLAAVQPEGAIVVDEAVTSGRAYFSLAAAAPPHTYLALTGGAIGQGPPCATGAALACPDRRVLSFQADGSALYTLQALWTQAREGLDVTTILCANRSYRILQGELARSGPTSAAADRLTSLADPEIDWVRLAAGFGVPAQRVTTAEELTAALRSSLDAPGPQLVEAVL